ncbi:MAG: hypothetical protein ACRDDY_14050 [Clostridium sp.]|uniref:hypothetical protein n=1 Tax=Clostridium sp. TaxID=1506 RepID=UPI003EE6A2F5
MALAALVLAAAMNVTPAIASTAVADDPNLVYLNTHYALTQAERGLVCYGCGELPKEVKDSQAIVLSDQVLVESASAGVVFISTGVSEACPAGKQYVVNLADAHMEPLGVPCNAKNFIWSFSEQRVIYKYDVGDSEVIKHWTLN